MKKFFVVLAFLFSTPAVFADLYACPKGSGVVSYVSDPTGEACEIVKATEIFKATESESPITQFRRGSAYYRGEGVTQDYKEAVKWYRLAAKQGHAEAQFSLGLAYDKGEGVARDYEEAVKWYHAAAKQGHADAQINLGVMYYNGNGVGQDYQQAVKWYRLAAEQGSSDAQHEFGSAYYDGVGVLQDYQEAYIWFALAAVKEVESLSRSSRKLRDYTRKQLTDDELRQAKKDVERLLYAIESDSLLAKVYRWWYNIASNEKPHHQH